VLVGELGGDPDNGHSFEAGSIGEELAR
jgi:hypothetical protein